jgi:cytochrome b-561
MSFGVSALPFTYVAHFLGIVAVAFVFIWTIHFRGGIDYNAADTNLIFNVMKISSSRSVWRDA